MKTEKSEKTETQIPKPIDWDACYVNESECFGGEFGVYTEAEIDAPDWAERNCWDDKPTPEEQAEREDLGQDPWLSARDAAYKYLTELSDYVAARYAEDSANIPNVYRWIDELADKILANGHGASLEDNPPNLPEAEKWHGCVLLRRYIASELFGYRDGPIPIPGLWLCSGSFSSSANHAPDV